MPIWNVTARAELSHPPGLADVTWLRNNMTIGPVLVLHHDGPRIGATVDLDASTPLAAAQGVADAFEHALVLAGHTITAWCALEVRSPDETDRQLKNMSFPKLMSTAEFATLCGVTPQRINELESRRKDAVERGEQPAFPRPVVPGWWLATAARAYAAVRPRKGGRPEHLVCTYTEADGKYTVHVPIDPPVTFELPLIPTAQRIVQELRLRHGVGRPLEITVRPAP